MTRILFFIESLSNGGAEKVLTTLLKHLDYSKYEVILMPLVDKGGLRNDIDMSKLEYTPVIHEGGTPWLRLWNKIKYKLIYHYLPCWLVNRWIIPQKGIDIYVAFTEGFATKLLSFTPQKKIAWVHADLKTDPWTQNMHIYRSLEEEKTAYQRYNEVVCVSKGVEQVMKDLYSLQQTTTIYNPIDTDVILQDAKQPINFTQSSSFKIVTVGRLVPQKGFDRLIRIIGKLRRNGKNVELFIVGEGTERKKLEHIIQEEVLENYVHLKGFMKNPYALMAKMDLFVCSSIAEGYSLVIAEAMTLGLPVISTECAGPKELLGNGEYGMLVVNNPDALYNGLLQAIDTPSLLEKLKQKSIEKRKLLKVEISLDQIEYSFS